MMHTAVFCCARLRGTGLRAAHRKVVMSIAGNAAWHRPAGCTHRRGKKTGGDRDGDDPVFSYSTYLEME